VIAERYKPEFASEWNEFVASSRNGTFLLDRGYMEYHKHRFVDHSIVLRDDQGVIVGILPASETGERLTSHGGLTYGGLVLGKRTGAADVLQMLGTVVGYLQINEIAGMLYKTIPWIYHRQPSEDDRYALFRHSARLVRRDVLSVVPCRSRLPFQSRRTRGVKAARKAGIDIVESGEFGAFWPILTENLSARFGVAPVHSVDEIDLLHSRFPNEIRLFLAQHAGETLAGVVVYETEMVAHVQYISASEAGRDFHALDGIFDHLINQIYADKPYFDFGISNENHGIVLNRGLLEQKEGFGARCVAHDYYELGA
jgi:hypothetical protein